MLAVYRVDTLKQRQERGALAIVALREGKRKRTTAMVALIQFEKRIRDTQEAATLSMSVANFFQPRAPISTREFFAGRWEQLTTVAEEVNISAVHGF